MDSNNRPLILVSNDDGYQARGVRELMKSLNKFGEVVAVCPDAPRSGQSMAITVNDALRATHVEDFDGMQMWKVNGTPVDCVKLAMHVVLGGRRPDLVVAGINHGSNSSVNVLYSGTMGATFEGCAFGIPSIGFSLTDHSPDADFDPCLPFVERLVSQTLLNGLPDGVCLNVNIPDQCTPTEMRLARACRGNWSDEYKEYTDPHGHKFYWLTGKFRNDEPDAQDTDEWCLSHGIVSVVPTLLDRTAPVTSLEMAWLRGACSRID